MNRFFDKWERTKERHPERIVLLHAGGMYVAFDGDAVKLHEMLGMILHPQTREGDLYKCFSRFVSPELDNVISKLIIAGEKLCTIDFR